MFDNEKINEESDESGIY